MQRLDGGTCGCRIAVVGRQVTCVDGCWRCWPASHCWCWPRARSPRSSATASRTWTPARPGACVPWRRMPMAWSGSAATRDWRGSMGARWPRSRPTGSPVRSMHWHCRDVSACGSAASRDCCVGTWPGSGWPKRPARAWSMASARCRSPATACWACPDRGCIGSMPTPWPAARCGSRDCPRANRSSGSGRTTGSCGWRSVIVACGAVPCPAPRRVRGRVRWRRSASAGFQPRRETACMSGPIVAASSGSIAMAPWSITGGAATMRRRIVRSPPTA